MLAALALPGRLLGLQALQRRHGLVVFIEQARHLARVDQRLVGLLRSRHASQVGALARFNLLDLLLQAQRQRRLVFGLGLVEQGPALGADFFRVHLDPVGRFLQGLLDALVQRGAEQGLQDLLALLRVGLEELEELALRQHDHLAELLALETQQGLNFLANLPPARLDRHFDLASTLGGQARQLSDLRLGDLAPAAFGRAILLGHALDAVALLAQREVEAHLGQQVDVGVVTAHLLAFALAA